MRTKAGRCCSVPHMHNVPFGTTGQEDRTWSNYTGQAEEFGATRENLQKPGVLDSKPLLLKQILIKVLSHALVKWLVVLQSLGFIQNIWWIKTSWILALQLDSTPVSSAQCCLQIQITHCHQYSYAMYLWVPNLQHGVCDQEWPWLQLKAMKSNWTQ